MYLLFNKFQVRGGTMLLHLIVVGWDIFTAVFSFHLVQIFLYRQEKIALVDIRNIPVLLILIAVPLIPITIHSFKKLTSAENTYWSWCLFGVYGIFVLALIFIRNLNTIAIYSSAIIDTFIILCLEKFITAMKERSNSTPPQQRRLISICLLAVFALQFVFGVL